MFWYHTFDWYVLQSSWALPTLYLLWFYMWWTVNVKTPIRHSIKCENTCIKTSWRLFGNHMLLGPCISYIFKSARTCVKYLPISHSCLEAWDWKKFCGEPWVWLLKWTHRSPTWLETRRITLGYGPSLFSSQSLCTAQ